MNNAIDTSILEAPQTSTQSSLTTSWQVVVYDDPINLMSYVTMVFQQVFGFEKSEAEKRMFEVHHQGKSILWVGTREKGELFVQQLQSYLLIAVLEPIL